MSNAKKKNVKRFIEIISHNVAEDAYHGGGESTEGVAIALSPIKATNKIRLNFANIAPNNYTDYASCDTIATMYKKREGVPSAQNYFIINPEDASLYYYFEAVSGDSQIFVRTYLNEAKTQVCAEIGSHENYEEGQPQYGNIIPCAILYTSETPIQMETSDPFPAEIVSQFASIEFDVPESFVNAYIALNIDYEENCVEVL